MRLLCVLCVGGVLTGVLLVDGTFINFRGDQVRRAIEAVQGGDWEG